VRGHVSHGVEREYEHRLFLGWLLDTIGTEAVDALLVAGDVVAAANPSASATKRWCHFLDVPRTHPLRFPLFRCFICQIGLASHEAISGRLWPATRATR
jgi:DNA repair exonuclease SbcCD nuclease subunit